MKMEEMHVYAEWNTPRGVKVSEVNYDYDLHAFRIELNDREVLLVPNSIEGMKEIRKDLNEGACPYEDNWEDGYSNFIVDLLDGYEY